MVFEIDLDRAIEVLNAKRHRFEEPLDGYDIRWVNESENACLLLFNLALEHELTYWPSARSILTEFEAIAVAEKYLREQCATQT